MIPEQHTLDTPYLVGPVHCYSTEIAGELILYDTGPPTLAASRYLAQTLDLSRLRHVIISHCHPDHYGLAHWLEQHSNATIYLPFRDYLKFSKEQERKALLRELLLQVGFDDTFIQRLAGNERQPEIYPSWPERCKIIEESLPPELGIEVLPCPGHSQSDLVLSGADWAVTGDVLLRGIFQTPLLDIDLVTEQRFRNYHAYCATLTKLPRLKDKKILPGHREYITSIDDCLLFYLRKMLARAARISKLPLNMNAVETISKLLHDDLKAPMFSFLKVSEVIFLRDFLAEPELLYRAVKEIGLYPLLAKELAPFYAPDKSSLYPPFDFR